MAEQESVVTEQPMAEQEPAVTEQSTEPSSAEDGGKTATELAPGEKAFCIAFFLLGVAAFWQSLDLWLSIRPPRAASAGAVPLFVSAAWMILSLVIVIENFRRKTPLSGKKPFTSVLWQGLTYAFPQTVLVMMLASIAYCVALLLGVGFYISTGLFLWGSTCYLTGKNFIKNILWTAITLGFIFIVFDLVFQLLLP